MSWLFMEEIEKEIKLSPMKTVMRIKLLFKLTEPNQIHLHFCKWIKPMALNPPWAESYRRNKENMKEINPSMPQWTGKNWYGFLIESQLIDDESETTQLILLPQHPSSLRGKKIYVYGLDTPHRKFSITPKDKYHDKWTLIQSIQKHT